MQERSFSVQWVVSISLVDRKYKHIWSYIVQGDFLLNKNAKYFLEGFTAPFTNQPFTGLYKPESSLMSQEDTTHLKEGKTVSAHFQLCYVPYHLLPAAIQYLYNKSGKRSLSVILCTFYPLEHNHYPHKKPLPEHGPSVPPRLVTWQMTSESGGSLWAKDLIFLSPRMELQPCRAHGWHVSEQN